MTIHGHFPVSWQYHRFHTKDHFNSYFLPAWHPTKCQSTEATELNNMKLNLNEILSQLVTCLPRNTAISLAICSRNTQVSQHLTMNSNLQCNFDWVESQIENLWQCDQCIWPIFCQKSIFSSFCIEYVPSLSVSKHTHTAANTSNAACVHSRA